MTEAISTDDDQILTGEQLRRLRRLARFSQPGLERCAGLRDGRVSSVESGRGRLRRGESETVKRLLLEELAFLAREIAKYIPAGGAFRTEGSETAAESSSP